VKPLVIIPTYNERENIGPIVSQIEALGIDLDCLFVEDGSPDGTADQITGEIRRHPWIRMLQRGGKLGIGSAHTDGLAWARSNGYSQVVTMDCDLTHSPSDIPAMLAAAGGADVVVGSRYMRRGSLEGWNLHRKALTKTAHLLTRTLLGIPYDCTGAFRVYNLGSLPAGLFDLVRSRNYAFFFESLFILATNGAKIVEVPISLPPRTYGSSKMPADEPFRGIRQLVSIALDRVLRPETFRVVAHPISPQPDLEDAGGWNAYWTRSAAPGNRLYQAIATAYRRLIITRRLTREVRRVFQPGESVLHAGCGSGHVDQYNQDYIRITAVDTSRRALEIYSRCVPRAAALRHASIFNLPFADGTFDGVYHLGVIEHFDSDAIQAIFRELRRVLKPTGRMLIFWPHKNATSVAVLGLWHALGGKTSPPLHPPELSHAQGKDWVRLCLERAGFEMDSYSFGFRDFWVQAVITAHPSPNPLAPSPPPIR
jgi:dolichol-phosphate mannosyltransferase